MLKNKVPLVSIAILSYNQADYLNECIQSIISQSYSNWEIIVADDHSTDKTIEFLKYYKQKLQNKFTYHYSEKNNGITKNSNIALSLCKGEYIAWMGGDDLLLPKKLEYQINYFLKNPNCIICYHNLDVFDSSTGKTLYYFNKKPYEGNIKTLIKYGCFNGACSTMVKLTKENKKIKFNEAIPVASDWLYWIEVLSFGGTINYLGQTLGRYRRHSSNTTNKTYKIIFDYIKTCNILNEKYPEYSDISQIRLSEIYRSMRIYIPSKYQYFLIESLKTCLNWKSILSLIVYYISFKQIKL